MSANLGSTHNETVLGPKNEDANQRSAAPSWVQTGFKPASSRNSPPVLAASGKHRLRLCMAGRKIPADAECVRGRPLHAQVRCDWPKRGVDEAGPCRRHAGQPESRI